MSKKVKHSEHPDIVLATREARELFRIRNSFTFNLGIELIRSLKNPLRLVAFPFKILNLLFSPKQEIPADRNTPRTGFVVVGVDRIGEHYSTQAELLANVISKSELGDVTLLNNSSTMMTNLDDIEWYRIPPVRDKNKSRKEWNLTMERLLSSAVSISRPRHIIYFGDYLYRGIIDAFNGIESTIPVTWFLSSSSNNRLADITKSSRVNPILLPEFSNLQPSSQSIHRILRRSESEKILLTDIMPKNQNLSNLIINYKENFLMTAVQREFPLPKGIEHVVRMKEIAGMQLEGKVAMIIDDESPLLSSLPMLKVPCLLLRTGEILSPILEEMIRDLELKGSLVVIRRNENDEIYQSLKYFFSLSDEYFSPSKRHGYHRSHHQADYVIKWLKKSPQSYN
tara:strand:- start:945 stop:2135 length:1191 start_codon:yes stop_codon:yes gene_type:complete